MKIALATVASTSPGGSRSRRTWRLAAPPKSPKLPGVVLPIVRLLFFKQYEEGRVSQRGIRPTRRLIPQAGPRRLPRDAFASRFRPGNQLPPGWHSALEKPLVRHYISPRHASLADIRRRPFRGAGIDRARAGASRRPRPHRPVNRGPARGAAGQSCWSTRKRNVCATAPRPAFPRNTRVCSTASRSARRTAPAAPRPISGSA